MSASCNFLDFYTRHDSKECLIDLNAFEPWVLDLIFQYFYSGNLEINQNNIVKLLELACFLKCKSIISECSFLLIRQLNARDNNCVFDIYQLSKKLQITELLNATELFINLNFSSLMYTNFLKEIDILSFRFLIQSCKLNIDAIQLSNSINIWATHYDLRKFLVPDLLSYMPKSGHRIQNEDQTILVAITDSNFVDKYHLRLDLDDQYPLAIIRQFSMKKNFSIASIESKIFIAGGFENSLISNSVFSFDFYTKSWISLENTNGGSISLTAFNNALYVAGGNQIDSEGLDAIDSFKKFDFFTGKWLNFPKMSVKRSNFCSVIFENCLYVFLVFVDFVFVNLDYGF